MLRFERCCEALCIHVCWVARCIALDVIVQLGAHMFAG